MTELCGKPIYVSFQTNYEHGARQMQNPLLLRLLGRGSPAFLYVFNAIDSVHVIGSISSGCSFFGISQVIVRGPSLEKIVIVILLVRASTWVEVTSFVFSDMFGWFPSCYLDLKLFFVVVK
jgi:hypothetical protein